MTEITSQALEKFGKGNGDDTWTDTEVKRRKHQYVHLIRTLNMQRSDRVCLPNAKKQTLNIKTMHRNKDAYRLYHRFNRQRLNINQSINQLINQ